MDNLTATERKVLNNLSNEQDPNVDLGDEIHDLIDTLKVVGTPVNAVNALEELGFTGVVKHGEKVTINNPTISGSDAYEFLADEAQTKSVPSNIAVDIKDVTVKGTVSLTMDTQPTAGDKVTLGEKVYTFVPVGTDTADGEVSIGDDLAGAQGNLFMAINGTDNLNTPHPLVRAVAFDANVCVITALIGGTAGNIASTETFTAGTNVFNHATLVNGADCTAVNAVTALVASITAHDTQGVGAVDGDGNVIDLTVDVAGEAGNDIILVTTIVNSAFGGGSSTTMLGGVDGTVSSVHGFMVDASYLYVCIAANTVSGKNWRRISLGSAY